MYSIMNKILVLLVCVVFMSVSIGCGGEPVDEPLDEEQEAYLGVDRIDPSEEGAPAAVKNLKVTIGGECPPEICGTPVNMRRCFSSCAYCLQSCTLMLPPGAVCMDRQTRQPCR